MLESLRELRGALQARGGDLVLARGAPERELPALAQAHGAQAVYFASDVSPFALARDRRVEEALRAAGVEPRRTPGNFVADIGKPKPYVVFTPFWRAWRELAAARRCTARRARSRSRPACGRPDSGLRRSASGEVPSRLPGGERPAASACTPGSPTRTTARPARGRYVDAVPVSAFRLRQRPRARAARSTRRAPTSASSHGATSTPTCCCTTRQRAGTRSAGARRDRMGRRRRGVRRRGPRAARAIPSSTRACASSRDRLDAQPRAADRGSFLVKDLHIDWRRGEAHFMRLLLDGDRAEQRQLAVDRVRRGRSRAREPPALQPRPAAAPPRPGRRPTCAAGCRSCATYRSRSSPAPGRRATTRVRSSTTRSSAERTLRGLPRRRARKLTGTWAASRSSRAGRSRSRPRRASSPGWPPGQGQVDDDEVRLRFLVDDWSGPAHVVLRRTAAPCSDGRGRQRGARGRAGRADRLARPRRHGLRRRRRARPGRGRLQRGAAICARCSSTRPTRPPRGRCISARTRHAQAVKLRDALSVDGIFPAPRPCWSCVSWTVCPPSRSRACTASPRPRSMAGSTASRCSRRLERGLHASAGAPGHRPVLRRADPAPRGRDDRRRWPTTSRASTRRSSAATAARSRPSPTAGGPSAPGSRCWCGQAHDRSSTSSATSRPASRRCT